MPIFISYSHSDATFANKLAAHLVKHNAHVWIDSWELNVGDSILAHVQQAIQESSALLIVLSKASVESEWCKKELNAGLMRELEEKRVLVLPVLLENCDIPMFLREKTYADFRTIFDCCQHALDGGPNYSAMPRRYCGRVLRFQSAVRREQEALCAPEMTTRSDARKLSAECRGFNISLRRR